MIGRTPFRGAFFIERQQASMKVRVLREFDRIMLKFGLVLREFELILLTLGLYTSVKQTTIPPPFKQIFLFTPVYV